MRAKTTRALDAATTLLCVALLACASCATRETTNAGASPVAITSGGQDLTTAGVLESARNALDGVGSYEAGLNVRIEGMTGPMTLRVDATLRIRQPRQAFVSLNVDDGNGEAPPIYVVFDGEHVWFGQARAEQRRLSLGTRVFESMLKVDGLGLWPRKDLVETVRACLGEYAFGEAETREDVVILRGEMSAERVVELFIDPRELRGVESTPPELREMQIRMLASQLVALRHLELHIDAATSLPRRLTFSGGARTIDVEVARFDTQAEFGSDAFQAPEALRANAEDVTERLARQFEEAHAGPREIPPEFLEALLSKIREVERDGPEALSLRPPARQNSGPPPPTETVSIALAPGFSPDPQVLDGVSAGTRDASQLSADCIGNISDNPNFHFEATGSFPRLRIMVASNSDLTLVVERPDGTFLCNDDSEGLNPMVEGAFPPGRYKVWVGGYGASESGTRFRLGLSELPDTVPSSLRPGGAP